MHAQTNLTAAKALIALRIRKQLTQSEVASRMNTVQPAVARLEAKLIAGELPSIKVLERYANALGRQIVIRFRRKIAFFETVFA